MKRLFRKQVLRFGRWQHPAAPGGVLEITPNYVEDLVENFGHTPFVPVTRGHVEQLEAEKNPQLIVSRNVKQLVPTSDGLDAEFEIDEAELDKYNDVSVSIDPAYVNHESGEVIGPVLKHIALVVNPFIKQLNKFVPLAEQDNFLIYLSEIQHMEEQVQVDQVATDQVAEVNTEVENTTEVETEATTTEAAAENPETEAPAEEIPAESEVEEVTSEAEEAEEEAETTEESIVDASDTEKLIKQISNLQAVVAKQSVALAERDAEAAYQDLLQQGKLVPAQKDAFISLASLPAQEIQLGEDKTTTIKEVLKQLFDNAPKVIEFSEKGVDIEAVKKRSDLPASFMQSLKQQFSNLSEDQFNEYVEKNRETLVQHID